MQELDELRSRIELIDSDDKDQRMKLIKKLRSEIVTKMTDAIGVPVTEDLKINLKSDILNIFNKYVKGDLLPEIDVIISKYNSSVTILPLTPETEELFRYIRL